jgi:hypothetical protein
MKVTKYTEVSDSSVVQLYLLGTTLTSFIIKLQGYKQTKLVLHSPLKGNVIV